MSDWKKQAAIRRDFRQKKAEVRPAGGSKKDTKRWCRGKVGIEHTPKCMLWREWTRHPERDKRRAYQLACTTCGKTLDYYFPPFDDRPHEKPDWVTE